MTNRDMQIAEAVREAIHEYNGVDISAVDLNSAIASVPKPDPAVWMRPDELQKVKVSPYLCHGWNERDKQSDAIPLYTYPPDAQAEHSRFREKMDTGHVVFEIKTPSESERNTVVDLVRLLNGSGYQAHYYVPPESGGKK